MSWKNLFRGGLIVTLLLMVVGSAAAAEIEGGDIFILDSSEVIDDDYYVAGQEIIINGTIKGDLIVAGGYIEVNGTVEGDLFAVGGGVTITGNIGDDARVGGGGVNISGTIGDDLFVAGGGQPGAGSFPLQLSQSRTVNQGLFISGNTEIGGDLYAGGGIGQVAGTVGGDANVGMGAVTFAADVAGDVELASDQITFGNDAAVDGNLTVSATNPPNVPAGVADSYVFNEITPTETEQPSLASRIWAWSWRTALALIGFAALSWLVLRFRPQIVREPAAVLADAPGKSAAYGLVAALAFIFIPLVSMLLVALVWTFFGVAPAIILLVALFGILSLVWIFSPLVTGYWLGRLFGMEALTGMLVGVAAVVVLIRLPFVGWLIALVSFLFAFGALLVMWLNLSDSDALAAPKEKPLPAAVV